MYNPVDRIDPTPWWDNVERIESNDTWIRLAASRSAFSRPFSIYVHIPFCRETCAFCALYRFSLPHNDGSESKLDGYELALEKELELYDELSLPAQPSTVHFGGGTPMTLGKERLTRVMEGIISAFNISNDTEWAIETTSSSLTDDTLDFLHAQGFSRIHVGVQTLVEKVRAPLGRREDSASVVRKLSNLLERGFSTSVDLIIGLDNQGVEDIEQEIEQLWELGIRTFSVCELFIGDDAERRARFSSKKIREHNFHLWIKLHNMLTDKGLRSIHYGQFAESLEDNLYYTHPARGEACVALGAYAHGSFDNCFYGNKLLDEYLPCAQTGEPFIGFGIVYNEKARAVRAFESEMLSTQISGAELDGIQGRLGREFTELWQAWLNSDSIVSSGGEGFEVTAKGNWYLGNMIRDLRKLA
jgi:coproporphyrinogen III oxidase-like Fe-S oxidoreductase